MEEIKNNAVEKVENISKEKGTENKSVSQKTQTDNLRQEGAITPAERERIKGQKRLQIARAKAKKQEERERAKAEILRERKVKKAQKLAQKERIKEQKRQNRKSHQLKHRGYLTAVICLGITTLALASALAFTIFTPQQPDADLESLYSRSFYDTVKQVENMDLNLSKVLATNDSSAQQLYLMDIAVNSELAEQDVQQLPLADENKFYTTKLINQIGDYSKYLNKKLINGESLDSQDRQNLTALYNANLALRQSLNTMLLDMGNDFSFASIKNADSSNVVIQNFNKLQNLSVEYPELIYDGPFSDGQNTLTVKGIKGDMIDRMQAEEIFKGTFADMEFTSVATSQSSNSKFECFNVFGKTADGEVYAEISKQGGSLIMFDYAGSCEEVNYQTEDALNSANEFLQKVGLTDMSPVWVNLAGNVYTINFAYETDGVIVYPDMAKVRVCAQTNKVIGLEATSYYANHTQRDIKAPLLTKSQAAAKVNGGMQIETVRLCVCPTGLSTETLCYEISGEVNGATYYVYISATNGRQVEMFKVIESTEGKLLM